MNETGSPKFSKDDVENLLSALDTQQKFMIAAKHSSGITTENIGYWNVRLMQNREQYSKLLVIREDISKALKELQMVEAEEALTELSNVLNECQNFKDVIPEDIFPIIVGLSRKLQPLTSCEYCGMIH